MISIQDTLRAIESRIQPLVASRRSPEGIMGSAPIVDFDDLRAGDRPCARPAGFNAIADRHTTECDSNIGQLPRHTAGLKRAKVFQMTVAAASMRAHYFATPEEPALAITDPCGRGGPAPGALPTNLNWGIWGLR